MASHAIHAHPFLRWLGDLGILPPLTRRVVIDADIDGPVKMYIECYGSEKLIEVAPPADVFKGTQITILDQYGGGAGVYEGPYAKGTIEVP